MTMVFITATMLCVMVCMLALVVSCIKDMHEIRIIYKQEYTEVSDNVEDMYDNKGDIKSENKDDISKTTIDSVLSSINKIMVGDDHITEDDNE